MMGYGYENAAGDRISALIDMINGGGPGRSGGTFEGGGILSLLGTQSQSLMALYGSDPDTLPWVRRLLLRWKCSNPLSRSLSLPRLCLISSRLRRKPPLPVI